MIRRFQCSTTGLQYSIQQQTMKQIWYGSSSDQRQLSRYRRYDQSSVDICSTRFQKGKCRQGSQFVIRAGQNGEVNNQDNIKQPPNAPSQSQQASQPTIVYQGSAVNDDSASPGSFGSTEQKKFFSKRYEGNAATRPPLVEDQTSKLGGGVRKSDKQYNTPTKATRNLIEQAKLVNLCTVMSTMHHRRAGYPFGTLIEFAADGEGVPVFGLSPLDIHARNILENPRCSIIVQIPGWTGLTDARLTIFGEVYQLPNEQSAMARVLLQNKHSGKDTKKWISGDYIFFRMHVITDIYFVGGFGTVQFINPTEYLQTQPDTIVLDTPQATLTSLTHKYQSSLSSVLSSGLHTPVVDPVFIAIDAKGADVRVQAGAEFTVVRIPFESDAESSKDAERGIEAYIKKNREA